MRPRPGVSHFQRMAWWLGVGLLVWLAGAHGMACAQGPPLDRATLTPTEQAWLAGHPVLHQALAVGDYPPFEFYGPDGSFTGISGDYLNAVAARLGLRVERRYYESWPKALAAVGSGQADIVASVVPTPERARSLALSDSYASGHHFIVVRHSEKRIQRQADLAGKRIAIEEGFSRREKLAALMPDLRFVEAKDTASAIRLVFAGGADAYVGNGLVVSYLLHQMDLQDLELRGEVDLSPNNLAFGLRLDAPELLSLVNRALASLTQEERQAIRRHWVPDSSERPSIGNALGMAWPFLLTLLLGATVVLAWNRSLRLQVRRREQAEGEAQAVRRQLADMTHSLPLVVFQRRVEPDGRHRYSFVSEQAGPVLGVPAQRILEDEELLWQQVHPEDRATMRHRVAEATARREPLRLQFRVVVDGATRWIDSASTVTTRADGAQERNGFWLDISALKEAQEAAEAATRAKSEFLANMSHEIRTPMNAILGMSHLLLEGGLAPRPHHQALKVQRAAKSLLGIINDILDFSKIEAGRLDIEQVPFDLGTVLDHWAGLLAQQADEKGLELLVEMSPRLPTRLIGDPLRLGQVLLNLGNNAVKFTSQGEVTLRIEEIDDGGAGPGGGVALRFGIHDTGVGISEAQQQRLFVPFEQADSSVSRRFGGTGLGLVISRHLIELMGGSLGVHSRVGIGSSFVFEGRWGLSSPGAAPPPPLRLNGERLLVIDGNSGARRVLVEMARALGLEAESVEDGWSGLRAVALAHAARRPFRIVLVALKMPGMDGIECAQGLRDAAGEQPPAVLLTTAFTQDEQVQRLQSASAGVQDVLVKPVTPAALFDACAIALGGEPPPSLPAPPVELARSRAQREMLRGARVLLVEDNDINQELAIELLTGAGIEVSVAGDGRQALDVLGRERFDAVLMDCQMPVMDGYEATRAIRGRPGADALPIIAMTANAMAGDREKALAAGMNDHIAKPIDVDKMFATLARWLRR